MNTVTPFGTAHPAPGAGDSAHLVVLLDAQKHALEMMLERAPLADVLGHLVQTVERQAGGRSVASILLLDDEGALRRGASPSLPEDYQQAIDGLKMDARVGTCCAAAATGEVVVTECFATAPGWDGIRHLPLALGLVGAWSQPIKARDGRVLGTFGTYFREQRGPTPDERRAVAILAHTAALAIERERGEAQMREAEQALRDADRRKDEFLAVLAHELRNPLAPLANALQLLASNRPDPQTVQRLYRMMDRQVAHMVRLVDDLMDASRVSRGTIELAPAPADLRTVLRHAIETSRPLIESAGHRLAVELPDTPIPLHADAVRLNQVFANLLNNAARYTPAGGSICVAADLEGGEARVAITDSGKGIEPSRIGSIFDLFVQGEPHGGAGSTGLGVGLALARELVQLHGGTIHADSAGAGKGARFTVRLPLAAAAPAAAPQASAATAAIPDRVLMVDDNRDAADSMAALLRMYGAAVEVVYDGQSALDACLRARPDVVLLDLGMPGMDGYATAAHIRARPEWDDVALVALSGWNQAADRARTEAAGFDCHLSKPADFATLLSTLEQLRAARRTPRAAILRM